MERLQDTMRSVAGLDSSPKESRTAHSAGSTRRIAPDADMTPQERADYWGFACLMCDDERWVHVLNDAGAWPKRGEPGFGKLERCPNCTDGTVAETAAKRKTMLYSDAGFKGRDVKRIETFDTTRQTSLKGRTEAELAKRVILEWAGAGGPPFVLLTGGPGVGKTHLAEAATALVIDRGDAVVYITGPDFSFDMHREFKDRHEALGRLRDAPYLVLDEVLGARDGTGFVAETLQDLLSHRTQTNKPTLLAGNLFPKGETQAERKQWWTDRVGERFVSRMTDKTMVKRVEMWECDDLRPRQQGELI